MIYGCAGRECTTRQDAESPERAAEQHVASTCDDFDPQPDGSGVDNVNVWVSGTVLAGDVFHGNREVGADTVSAGSPPVGIRVTEACGLVEYVAAPGGDA